MTIMTSTYTITSKDVLTLPEMKLLSVIDYDIFTKTFNAERLKNLYFEVDNLDDEMHAIETAGITDLLNFERAD